MPLGSISPPTENAGLRVEVLSYGQFCPLRTFGNVWRHFWLLQPEGGATGGILQVEARAQNVSQ